MHHAVHPLRRERRRRGGRAATCTRTLQCRTSYTIQPDNTTLVWHAGCCSISYSLESHLNYTIINLTCMRWCRRPPTWALGIIIAYRYHGEKRECWFIHPLFIQFATLCYIECQINIHPLMPKGIAIYSPWKKKRHCRDQDQSRELISDTFSTRLSRCLN